MKILHVTPYFVPAWGFGGPVRVIYDLASRTAKSAHKVTVATTDALDGSKRVGKLHEFIGPVEVFRFRNLSPRLAKGLNLYLPLGFKKFIRSSARNYDIVQIHAFFTYQNIEAAKFCQRYHIPYILHLHETPLAIEGRGKLIFKKLFLAIWGKRILNRASRILVLTTREKQALVDYLPNLNKKIEILPNGVDIKKTRPRPLKMKGDKVILSLSRLNRSKGTDLLIRAYAVLAKRDRKYKLIIAGSDEGGELKRLKNLVEELGINKVVSFVGHLEGSEKENAYKNADIYALFSRFDAFGITVLEAMSYGLPVCISKEVGVIEDISHFGCVNIVQDTNNPEESAEAIAKTYENRYEMIRNCATALKQFDIATITKKLLKIYNGIVKQ